MILTEERLSTDTTEAVSNDEAVEIIKELEKELHRSSIAGIGLAAPQIGIDKAVAIIRIPNSHDSSNPIISFNLVNPVLVEAEGLIRFTEGCLSFPDKYVTTIRYEHIIIETADDYAHQAAQLNAKRHDWQYSNTMQLSTSRRRIQFGPQDAKDELGRLISVCVQHEANHLIGKDFRDFKPRPMSRNELCPCGSNKKNKHCHNYSHFNVNLNKLFEPNYKKT